MGLILRRFESAAAFSDAALLYLLKHEAEHCLPIGLTAQAIEDPNRWDGPPVFALVERDGEPVAVTIRTPPYEPVLSRITDMAAIPLLVDLYVEQSDVTGVMAPIDIGRAFGEEWTRRTGGEFALAMPERIYKIERVKAVPAPPGVGRLATVADRPILLTWTEEFVLEAFGERAAPGHAERSVDTRLNGGQSGLALWENSEPVCMLGWSGPTPNSIRIGPVYTPPEFRRMGYATALTALISQMLLDDGFKFCVLFADLDNSTSNHVYQAIGYEPVADVGVYRFMR